MSDPEAVQRTAPKSSKSSTVKEVMKEFKKGELGSGKSGKKVKSRIQAIAIGLSEAREKGANGLRFRRNPNDTINFQCQKTFEAGS